MEVIVTVLSIFPQCGQKKPVEEGAVCVLGSGPIVTFSQKHAVISRYPFEIKAAQEYYLRICFHSGIPIDRHETYSLPKVSPCPHSLGDRT